MSASRFDLALEKIKRRTLIDPNRLHELWQTVEQCAPLGGAIVEVGVYKGGSAVLIRDAAPHAPLYLFDTFAGHPSTDPERDNSGHYPGRFNDTSLESVQALFEGHPNQPTFVQGTFPDSLAQVNGLPSRLCFVHVDVDLYAGTRACFEELWPLLAVGGAMICDDYGFEDCPGAKTAVREFVAATPGAELQELPTLQARVWKREVVS
jgi:O-methyltransferase